MFISGEKQPLGPVPPCSRPAPWSSWFCRLYCTVLSWISALVYFDSLSLMSWLHLQFKAVWRKAIQKAFAACFARMLSWQLSCAKTQQHISAFPYGSKPYFCSCSLRSDTILCVSTSHSDTTLNPTPMLSSVTSHAKGKHKRRLSSPLFLSVGGILGCHCGLLRICFQEQESRNRAEPALFSKFVHATVP